MSVNSVEMAELYILRNKTVTLKLNVVILHYTLDL